MTTTPRIRSAMDLGLASTPPARPSSPVAKEASPPKDVSLSFPLQKRTLKKQALPSRSARPSAQQLRLWQRVGLWGGNGPSSLSCFADPAQRTRTNPD